MAYSTANIGATELTLFTANKPAILGHNGLYVSTNTAFWANAENDTTDRADSSYPSSRLYDGHDYLQSAPASAATTWYLKCHFTGEAIEADTVALLNFSLPNINTITVAIADNNAFTSNKLTFSGITQKSVVNAFQNEFDLRNTARFATFRLLSGGDSKRISSLVYLYFKFDFASSTKPYIGEVLVGRRRQLKHNPDVPWDQFNLRSSIDKHISHNGAVQKYVRARNQRRIEALLRTSETAYGTDLETLFRDDMRGGQNNFLWADNPSTAPQQAVWMDLDEPSLSGPYLGPNEREWRIVANEVGPNFYADE